MKKHFLISLIVAISGFQAQANPTSIQLKTLCTNTERYNSIHEVWAWDRCGSFQDFLNHVSNSEVYFSNTRCNKGAIRKNACGYFGADMSPQINYSTKIKEYEFSNTLSTGDMEYCRELKHYANIISNESVKILITCEELSSFDIESPNAYITKIKIKAIFK